MQRSFKSEMMETEIKKQGTVTNAADLFDICIGDWLITEEASDGILIRDAYDAHFKEGVVTADPEMLLGIQRIRRVDENGVIIIGCVQPDFIETLFRAYEDDEDMPTHHVTELATPHLHLDLAGDSVKGHRFDPPSAQESAAMIDRGYRTVVGS
eukprot:SAG11_NODE_3817_length_2210_cov_2.749408_2_plen_154_part_00